MFVPLKILMIHLYNALHTESLSLVTLKLIKFGLALPVV